VFGFYRDQIARANGVLHMIEETARHLGHLDAARELIDGAVELGQDEW
jgi:hypothetical protein